MLIRAHFAFLLPTALLSAAPIPGLFDSAVPEGVPMSVHFRGGVAAEDLTCAGQWEGAIKGAGLDIEVELAGSDEEGWTGKISIPAQGAKGMDLEGFKRTDSGALRFAIAGIPGEPAFEATLSGDGKTLAGPFLQGGATLTFELTRQSGEKALSEEQLAELGAWIDGTRESWQVPGLGVAIVTSDEVLFAGGFGRLDVGEDAKVDADTLFAIGSSSKAFTTLALAIASEEGDFRWDDRVQDRLPGFAMHDADVTRGLIVRDLVTHRTGLPRHDLMWYGRSDRTGDDIVAGIRHLELNKGLRETFQYNNLGFLVASHVLREVVGMPWSEFVPAKIFAPLGMSRSVLSADAFLGSENHAVGHRAKKDAEPRAAETVPYRNIDLIGPAGSIGSSANDMARWARLHLNGGELDGTRLVEGSTLRELHTPQFVVSGLPRDKMLGVTNIAHGWFVDSYRGHLRIHHGGNIDGFSALVSFFPSEDLAIVVLANMNTSAVPEYVVRRVADVAFGHEPRGWSEGDLDARDDKGDSASKDDPKDKSKDDSEEEADTEPERTADTKPSHDLAAYVSVYEHAGYGELHIEREGDGQLKFRLGELQSGLGHWHYDVFRLEESAEFKDSPLEGAMVRFEAAVSGDIVALHMALESSVSPIRFEVAADASLETPEALGEFTGKYTLDGMTMTASIRGGKLIAEVPGQPTMTLAATRADTFDLVELKGYSLKFRRDAEGKVDAVALRQPNGTFVALREADESDAAGEGDAGETPGK